MRYTVSQQDLTKIQLNETDTVASVLQNIALILSTRQQSVPLYREFGLPGHFVDRPLQAARPILIAEVQEAIQEFEPRAILRNISFRVEENAPGKLIPIVEVDITDGE